MSQKALTLSVAKAIIQHSEDTKYSITEFVSLFASGKVALSDVYTGGKYKRAINASRVFGGYLSGALKIEPTKWADLSNTFYKDPEGCAAIIAMGGDVLVGLNNLKVTLDTAATEAEATKRANGVVHKAAVASMDTALDKFIKAGLANGVNLAALEEFLTKANKVVAETRANEKASVAA
jgi:hypothetical protein